jgi:hypothetical protein
MIFPRLENKSEFGAERIIRGIVGNNLQYGGFEL